MKLGRSAGPSLWRTAEGPGVSASVSQISLSELRDRGSGDKVDVEVAEVDV